MNWRDQSESDKSKNFLIKYLFWNITPLSNCKTIVYHTYWGIDNDIQEKNISKVKIDWLPDV